ncbi:hypothetical protein SPRG_04171 [Saprolegnia parasitica CBS 223.65]|uniref:Uncharacterized protein n=1 Tax=Saprolegnia parasitica (strain CBS 223.65) TaxID=695850 RepID=A0A067CKC6_SAPPC|nr:hypothetical protein SPRG_04171 [Saprolegnia parasitica CBS 223.65]KDO30983.1 hypothetical protein SPRG_04171 [Saprolegnia parasitica CBS 223.65]|eukprot:XP_012198167.1 hypothetical protein SPRG_04171 [Saprolegnia parasitica CBS 223.65]
MPSAGPALGLRGRRSFTTVDARTVLSPTRILFTLASYVLFFTDIPRSGYGFATLPSAIYHQLTETTYCYWGPFDYPIVHIERHTNGSFVGRAGDVSLDAVPVWAYKFDTCSVGLRSLVQRFRLPNWDPCLMYASTCESATLPLSRTFALLDSVVETLASLPQGTTARSASYYKDKIHEVVAPTHVFMERALRTIHVLSIRSNDASNVCAWDRPVRARFCDALWANFSSMGPTTTVTELSRHIQARFDTVASTLDPRSQVADMVLIESTADGRQWSGSVAPAKPTDLDITAILRVRNCSSTNVCTTISVDDFRYEAALETTNVLHYYRLLRAMRLVGQLYNILRVTLLLFGCFYAHRNESQPLHQRVAVATGTFLRIPAQVIIYGSWCPVILFALAHAVDCACVYHIIFRAFSTLNGALSLTWDELYFLMTILTCQMRNVWVLSLFTKGLLVANGQHRVGQHILGFRGYVLPLVSLLAVGFDIRVLSTRDTDIIGASQVATSQTVATIRLLHSLPTNYRYWGLFLDARNLLMAFLIAHLVLRVFRVKHVRSRSLVPYAVTSYCNHSMFSTAWNTLVVDREPWLRQRSSIVGHKDVLVHTPLATVLFPSSDKYTASTHVLMNIVWMTDPIEVLVRHIADDSHLFVYVEKATSELVYHPWSFEELCAFDERLRDLLTIKSHKRLLDLPWQDRIYCS